jgi:hypothetical protein
MITKLRLRNPAAGLGASLRTRMHINGGAIRGNSVKPNLYHNHEVPDEAVAAFGCEGLLVASSR